MARIPVDVGPPDPTEPTGSYDDADDDATTPVTEILDLSVAVTATHVDATMRLADIWPTTSALSPTIYSLTIDGRKFDSFVRYPIDTNPMTWDNGAGGYMPDGSSSWDLAAKTVTFHIPRSYLAPGIVSPYFVSSQTAYGALTVGSGRRPGAGAGGHGGRRQLPRPERGRGCRRSSPTPPSPSGSSARAGNTFYPQDTSFGAVPQSGIGRSIWGRWTRATASTWTCRRRARSSST